MAEARDRIGLSEILPYVKIPLVANTHPLQVNPGIGFLGTLEGQAADKAEALQSAEKADPRVDLEWMRIRHERDLDVR